MSTTPYFPFYPADYMADTAHLSTEQHGAYMLLLMTAWARGGRLPNEPAKLARIARVSARRWHLIADDVLEFWSVDGDEIVSKRLEREHKKATSKSQKRSDAGKRGAKAKALKSNEQAPAIAKQTLKHSPEPEPLDTSVSKREARKRAERLPEDWTLPSEWIEDATSRGLTVEQAHDQAERMRDWSRSAPASKGAKLDWRAAWRNWIKRVCDDRATPRGGGGGNYADRQRAAADVAQSAAVRVAQRRMGWSDDDTGTSASRDDGPHLRVIEPGEPGGGPGFDRTVSPALPAPAAKRYGG